ncbi:MAG: thioredoxin domain-containing protein [Myxococcales bacterium]|nr:thioredoxin domain-containing protein [Myxococcales bacterium]
MFRALLAAGLLLVAGSALAGLPGVNLKGLSQDEVGDLELLMRQGACPCDPKVALYDCIEAKSCPAATELASFGADKMREGLSGEQVMKAVVQKYINEHVPPATFDLKETPSKGAKDGKVVIVEFADFECPHCAEARNIIEELVKAMPNEVTVYFKQFPIAFHEQAEPAARAALAAHRQGRFWPMHDLIFQNQGSLSAQKFIDFATELGLNVDRFKADMESKAVRDQVMKDRQEGVDAGLSATPTLYINGRMYLDDKTVDALKAHVKGLLTPTK